MKTFRCQHNVNSIEFHDDTMTASQNSLTLNQNILINLVRCQLGTAGQVMITEFSDDKIIHMVTFDIQDLISTQAYRN